MSERSGRRRAARFGGWFRGRRRWVGLCAAVVVLAGLVTWAVLPGRSADGFRAEDSTVRTGSGDQQVQLDTTLFVPDGVSVADPAPAVIVAHGFGGTKDSVRPQAEQLAGQGFVVLTYSARGFGRSTGQIGLDAPAYEVADASRLLDLLGQRGDVVQDGPGDPRVGITGPSYGGALALLAAGYDQRVDAIVPQITWNSLSSAFFPNSVGEPVAGTPAASPVSNDGVFKKLWAGLFFASGAVPGPGSLLSTQDGGADPEAAVPEGADPICGRFRPEICAAYTEAATTGRLSARTAALLERSSPASVLDRITAPTLLIQGESDTLFPLAQADANARGIAANGTPVKVVWYTGGHDAPVSEADATRLQELTEQWFDFYLRARGADPGRGFEFTQVTGLSTSNGRATSQTTVAAAYPGLSDDRVRRTAVDLSGPAQLAVNPPGGNPAAISTLPGLTQLTSLVGGVATDIPGQAAAFESAALTAPVSVVGAPTVTVRIAATGGSAVLFAKLYDVDSDGRAALPQGVIAPIRLTGLAATVDAATPVVITLPGIVHRFETGHRMRLVLASTDQAYGTPTQPTIYQVGLAGDSPALNVPLVAGTVQGSSATPWIPFLLVLAGLAAAATLGRFLLLLVRRRRGGSRAEVDPQVPGAPLVITGLTKAYADGFVAVQDLSFSVAPGQVVGLLGPNGAGKTTTLRMLMGLITPTAGELRVFGHRVRPGAPVLSRLGAFVEGTGFLPHLSGAENLELYWRATGRPAADAHLEEALEIAGLRDAVHKKVRTYSQGMRQRLAIAQAMLGRPDLLVLDEPTNGLDPPQIREMRSVLRRYAADPTPGTSDIRRSVLVSSHLLAEVEQTCTHVVVMHKGRLVAQGAVAEVIGESSSVLIGVDDQPAAVRVLTGLPGVSAVDSTPDGVVAEIDGGRRGAVVRELVGAGIGVQQLTPRRRLEDVFIDLVGQGRHDVD